MRKIKSIEVKSLNVQIKPEHDIKKTELLDNSQFYKVVPEKKNPLRQHHPVG